MSVKILRSQVRIAVKEEMPGILRAELTAQIKKELTESFNERFNALAKYIQSTMDGIEQRSKDVQAYVIRQNSNNKP